MKQNLQETVNNFIRKNGTNCSLWIEQLSERGEAASYAAETQLPAASLAKLLVVDAAINGRSIDDLDVPVTTIAELEPTHYPTVLATMKATREVTLGELCGWTIVTSDNPAASFLVQYIGIEAIRARIKFWGLTNTTFECSFSDSELGEKGRANLSSVRDLSFLIKAIWRRKGAGHYSLLWKWLVNNVRNHRLPAMLPDDLVVAHKTGSLKGVVNDVGIIETKPPVLIAAMMDRQADPVRASVELGTLAVEVVEILAHP